MMISHHLLPEDKDIRAKDVWCQKTGSRTLIRDYQMSMGRSLIRWYRLQRICIMSAVLSKSIHIHFYLESFYIGRKLPAWSVNGLIASRLALLKGSYYTAQMSGFQRPHKRGHSLPLLTSLFDGDFYSRIKGAISPQCKKSGPLLSDRSFCKSGMVLKSPSCDQGTTLLFYY